jgi:hypothetical protein
MSWCLVGSEMCIRDSDEAVTFFVVEEAYFSGRHLNPLSKNQLIVYLNATQQPSFWGLAQVIYKDG